MHKLMEYVCDELEELERKSDKGKLSMSEMEYADMLTRIKKNLLKTDEMMGEDEFGTAGSYAMGGNRGGRSYGNYDDMSYARGRGRNARRDAMGRYSREGYSRDGEMVEKLRDMMEEAPDEMTRKEFEKFIRKVEQM